MIGFKSGGGAPRIPSCSGTKRFGAREAADGEAVATGVAAGAAAEGAAAAEADAGCLTFEAAALEEMAAGVAEGSSSSDISPSSHSPSSRS